MDIKISRTNGFLTQYARKDLARNISRSSRSDENTNENGIYLRTSRFFFSLSLSLSLALRWKTRGRKSESLGIARNPFPPNFFFISLAEFNLERVQLHLPARLTGTRGYEALEDHRKNACAL